MDPNDSQYGSLTPNPDDEPEEKKKDNKKKALVGLAALALLGGCSTAICVGTGTIDKFFPDTDEEVVVKVTPTQRTYPTEQPTEQPSQPIPTEQEPVDVRESWLGNYLGITSGVAYGQLPNEIKSWEFEDYNLWLQIHNWEDCGGLYDESSFCPEELSWGIYLVNTAYTTEPYTSYVQVHLYLPEDMGDAPGLRITEDELNIAPTKEYPYSVHIERINGLLEGYMHIDWGNPQHESTKTPTRWVIEELTADRTAELQPPEQ